MNTKIKIQNNLKYFFRIDKKTDYNKSIAAIMADVILFNFSISNSITASIPNVTCHFAERP